MHGGDIFYVKSLVKVPTQERIMHYEKSIFRQVSLIITRGFSKNWSDIKHFDAKLMVTLFIQKKNTPVFLGNQKPGLSTALWEHLLGTNMVIKQVNLPNQAENGQLANFSPFYVDKVCLGSCKCQLIPQHIAPFQNRNTHNDIRQLLYIWAEPPWGENDQERTNIS